MTSSNGNIFRVTGHSCREFTGHRWIPRTKASDAELCWFFYLGLDKRLSKQGWGWWFETPSCPLWRHCNDDTLCRYTSRSRPELVLFQYKDALWPVQKFPNFTVSLSHSFIIVILMPGKIVFLLKLTPYSWCKYNHTGSRHSKIFGYTFVCFFMYVWHSNFPYPFLYVYTQIFHIQFI